MAESAGSEAAVMCDAQLIELLIPCEHEQALGLDCRGWRLVSRLFEKKDE